MSAKSLATNEPAKLGSDRAYASFATISDGTGAISFEAPTEWTDTDAVPSMGEYYQAKAEASTVLASFRTSWTAPGVRIGISKSLGAEVAAASLFELAMPTLVPKLLRPSVTLAQCRAPSVYYIKLQGLAGNLAPHAFEQYLGPILESGVAHVYDQCGEQKAMLVEIVGYSRGGGSDSVLHIEFQFVTAADIPAFWRALSSLRVDWTRVPEPVS